MDDALGYDLYTVLSNCARMKTAARHVLARNLKFCLFERLFKIGGFEKLSQSNETLDNALDCSNQSSKSSTTVKM